MLLIIAKYSIKRKTSTEYQAPIALTRALPLVLVPSQDGVKTQRHSFSERLAGGLFSLTSSYCHYTAVVLI